MRPITRRDTSECLVVPSKIKATPRHRKLMDKIVKIEENSSGDSAQNRGEDKLIRKENVETNIRFAVFNSATFKQPLINIKSPEFGNTAID